MGWSTRWCSNMYLSMLAMVFCGVIRGTIPTEQRMTHNDQWQTVAEKPRVSQTVTSYLPWFAMTKTMRSLPFTMDLPWIYHGFTTISIYFGKTFGSIFTSGKTCWIYHHFTTIFTNMFYQHVLPPQRLCHFRGQVKVLQQELADQSERHGKELKRRNVKRMWKIENSPENLKSIYTLHDYIWLSWLYMIIEKYIYITPW